MSEESGSPTVVAIWSDAMRRLRELGAQMTAAAQAVAVAGARATPPVLAQPLAGYVEQLLAVSAAVTTPLRGLLDEQERLVGLMDDWAQQHQLLSEQIAAWADQQRRLSESMVDLARPLLDQSAMLERLHAEWTGRSGDGGAVTSGADTAAGKAPARKSPVRKAPAKKSAAKQSASKRASTRRR